MVTYNWHPGNVGDRLLECLHVCVRSMLIVVAFVVRVITGVQNQISRAVLLRLLQQVLHVVPCVDAHISIQRNLGHAVRVWCPELEFLAPDGVGRSALHLVYEGPQSSTGIK